MLFYKQILYVRVFPLMKILQGLKHIVICYFNINNSKTHIIHLVNRWKILI